MDKTDRLRDYGLAFLLYEQGLGVCGYELIRELFIFVKLILNSYLLGNELSISYREIECGCEIFHVHDEGNFFPEECCVSSSGGSFDDVCEDVYDTISDAIKAWVEKTGIVQGERTNEEMVDFINEYVYDTDDTYFYIHPFEFD